MKVVDSTERVDRLLFVTESEVCIAFRHVRMR